MEWNPRAEQASPLANLRLLDEGRRRPAVMLGTSSDRIGTPEGQAYYVTVGKDLSTEVGVPFAPYVGLAYGTFEDHARFIGGAHVAFGRGVSALLIFDGVHLHPTLSYARGRHGVSLLLVRSRHAGISYNVRF